MTPVQKTLLGILKLHARKQKTCPTNEWLGEEMTTSTGVISTNMKLLNKGGWIKIEHKGGRRRIYITGTDHHTDWTAYKSDWDNSGERKERACLKCQRLFDSEGFGNRICPRCHASSEYRSLGSAFEV
jgi:ribosomal protein S27AE|tara:strand:+ start:1237 stop:1620 length:384 start_codon:yes stop_codon:yes gene_type:complete